MKPLRGSSDVAENLVFRTSELRFSSSLHILRQEPLIATIDGVVTPDEAQAMIDHCVQTSMKDAKVSGDLGGEVNPEERRSSVLWVKHRTTPIFAAVASRIAALVGSDLSHAENFQMIHYLPGGHYDIHYDAYDWDTPKGNRCLRKGGQRVTTTLCYLNTPEAGGSTEFTEKECGGCIVEARTGRLLIFNNCRGDSFEKCDEALHAGRPVERGEKWAFNLWFRQYPLSYNPVVPSDEQTALSSVVETSSV